MKTIHTLILLPLLGMLTACATFSTGTDVATGRQALFAGNFPAALGDFQNAAQADPNYIFGTELREGVYSYLGRAQYLTGNLVQARQTLQQALTRHKADNIARLYLGLTLARQGERQQGLRDIQSGMTGIYNFLNYMNNSFENNFGQDWDPAHSIRSSIDRARALISAGNIDWPQLITAGESIAMNMEQEEDRADLQQQQQQQIQMQR